MKFFKKNLGMVNWVRYSKQVSYSLGDIVRHVISKQVGVVVEIKENRGMNVRFYIDPVKNRHIVKGGCSFHGPDWDKMIESADDAGYYVKTFLYDELEVKGEPAK
jgi:hypothetical protein